MDADVIVVGAGPAGSTAACDLAQRGYDVLLLDRESFPRDKTCGDGVPPGSIEILNALGMADKIRAAGFYPIRGIRLGSPAGRIWESNFKPKREGAEFYIAPRIRFDTLIQNHAVESGARFMKASVKGPLLENGTVTGVRAVIDRRVVELRARVVIGADGATSAIARALTPPARRYRRHRSVAIRTYIDGIETSPNRAEFYFDRKFVPGYGWVFPLGPNEANVGVIMRVDRYQRSSDTLENLLEAFLGMPAVEGRLRSGYCRDRTATWQLPNGSPTPKQKSLAGALLVGDAAALVDPLTGEGIHGALVSATLAARVAARAVEENDSSMSSLREYDVLCEGALSGLLRRSYYVQRAMAVSPRWVELLFMLANANPGRIESILNRTSTDFLVEVPR